MNGYNPFTHSVNNHFFRVESDQPIIGLGYKKGGLHVVGNLIHSGRQIRVADTADDDGYSNGSVNASYTFGNGDRSLKVGVGYLHNTIYNSVIAHHPDSPTEAPNRQSRLIRNPACDVWLEYKHEGLSLVFERTATFVEWPATDFTVAATTFQAKYDWLLAEKPTKVSASYGIGRQGPDGEEYERLTQLALGIETEITPILSLSAEWVHNEAFVPLINIRRVSVADVKADAFIVGGKVTF